MNNITGITLKTGNFEIDRAFRIALGDMLGNVMHYRSGLLNAPAPCLVAGLSYPDPWTRDTAFNTWNGAGLLIPDVMKNTLLSCLTRGDAAADWQYPVGGNVLIPHASVCVGLKS